YGRGRPPVDIPLDGADATELFQQIQNNVPSDAVILCAKPTVIALHARRRTTPPPLDPTPDQFWRYIEQAKISWVVELKSPVYGWNALEKVMPKVRSGLEPVFGNRFFELYRVRETFLEPARAGATEP